MAYNEINIRLMRPDDMMNCLAVVAKNWNVEITQSAFIEFSCHNTNYPYRPVFYVAECDGNIIGHSAYCVSWANFGIYEISWVNVHPDYQSQGIGKRLVNVCFDDIQVLDGEIVLLSTDKPEYFSKHCGFELVDVINNKHLMKKGIGK